MKNLLPNTQQTTFGDTRTNETVRNTVVAIIIDPASQKILCQFWPEYDGLTCLLSGGIEGKESPDQAISREIDEETGYQDFTIVGTLGANIESHYTKKSGENFVKIITPYFVTLDSQTSGDSSKEEDEKFDNLWKNPEEILQMMNDYEEKSGSSLADHKEILNRGITYYSQTKYNKMIVFLEGLPGVGKSTLIKTLREKNVYCIDEIVNKSKDSESQQFYIKNDEQKIEEATQCANRLVVVDRGPLSTLAFNLAKHKLDKQFDFMPVVSWFTTVQSLYDHNDVKVLYLKGDSKLPYSDKNDPYGSNDNQKILEETTLSLAQMFTHVCVKQYDYNKNHQDLIDEILNKSICS